MRPPLAALAVAALTPLLGCSGWGAEPLLHDLPEREANAVLVALDEAGIEASKVRHEGGGGGGGGDAGTWIVSVPAADAGRAHRLLSARELPRPSAPGLGEVFGQGSAVPTPVEEHARWLHALAGELSRSVEALDGVVEARVHLGLPADDPLRPGARAPARAAVLVKCRPAACPALRAMEGGLRQLVAGAADGLVPEAVAVVVADAAETSPPPPERRRPAAARWLAALAALGAAGLAFLAWRERCRLGGPA